MAVSTPPPDTRPHLVRRIEASRKALQAVVHRTGVLRRQRERSGTTSPGAAAISKLPLELQGIRALEDVLNDLYALESLTAEQAERVLAEEPASRATDKERQSFTEWRPAREDDEPRIPELYRRSWKGEPDTLLALIRKALRLGEPELADDDRDVLEEKLAVGEQDNEEPETLVAVDPESQLAVVTTESVLLRYRGALVKLLERGIEYIRKAHEPALADLGFQAVLRLHEELERTEVTVDGEVLSLVERDSLLSQKVALLDAYLREREGRDPNCLATARAHLAMCLTAHEQLEPLEWETLERLAHTYATELLGDNPFAARAAEDAGVELGELDLLLRPYADRADWSGLGVEAERLLDDVDVGDLPFPWVAGADWFASTVVSPAWKLVGYGSVAGWQTRSQYGAVIRNYQPNSPVDAHAVVVDPSSAVIYEAFRRSADKQWQLRTYRHVSEGYARKSGEMGPDSILDHVGRSPYRDLDVTSTAPVVELLRATEELPASILHISTPD